MKAWYKAAIDLSNEGKSGRQIAKIVGRSKTQVNDILKKYKCPSERGKLLFLDIETSPLLCYVWSLWKQNIAINQIKEDWYLICYSAMWQNEAKIISDSLHHYDKREKYKFNEKFLIENLWSLLDEADFICAYNGIKFDKKKINAKFLEYGYPEPSPYKVIDPYFIVKDNFSFPSNKLDYVTKLLGNPGKHKTDMSLWVGCMEDDEESFDTMQSYCDNDIVELKNVYDLIKHWDKRHPNVALFYKDDALRCNTCGSDDLTLLEGKSAQTQISEFNVYRCNCCGKIVRDRDSKITNEKRKTLTMNVR